MAKQSPSVDNLADPLWRLSNLYWITDKSGQRVKFTPNTAQQQVLANLHGKDIILKARQRGITTLMCLVALDEALFLKDWRAAIIAHRLEDAKTIFETKVKYPYDYLDFGLREEIRSIKDSADTLHFSNGSSISVTTSARSGTLQRLHISEFGKVAAQNPGKTREIITGSLPAAERGFVTIESTAEGQEGKFYEMVQTARQLKTLGPKDYKFHFIPWWTDPEYVYDPELAVITDQDELYFEKLRLDEGISLTPDQKAWWVKTEREQGGDMKREYPATADEAFEQAIEGAYFERQLAHCAKVGSIGRFPYDPRYPVNTFWDLGMADYTTIWFHQRVGDRNRFLGFYENDGEHISHYINYVKEWARETGTEKTPVIWGDHYWPHDGKRNDQFLENGRLGEADRFGFRPRIVSRGTDKLESIEAGRAVFASCDFDEQTCSLGLKRLRHYRKEWDALRGVWRSTPRHDENSHGADAFLTFACGYKAPAKLKPIKRERNAWAA